MVRRRHLTKFGVLPDVASRPQADSCTAQILSHSITSSARLSSVGTMPSCFCRLEIYYQLALGRLHNRKFRGLFAHPTDIDTCLPSCVRQIGTVADKATKLVLDFLERPATMASRQHSGTKLSIRRGKPARRRQHHCCAGGCRYGGMVHAPAAVPALRRIHPVSRRNCHRRWKSENTNN
jgi:hypothetical protein